MTTNYSAQEITVLKDLEPVQTSPRYVYWHHSSEYLAQEVIDNSVDEALAGLPQKLK